MLTDANSPPALVVGLDMSTATSLRLAVLDPEAKQFPWTDDFRCCHSPRALMRYWERRFPPLCDERVVVAVNSTRHPEALLGLQQQGAEILAAAVQDLHPFLDESRSYEVPGQFRIAHALANYAAHKTHPRYLLEQAWEALAEVNGYLRDIEATLNKLATACRASPIVHVPLRPEPAVDLLPF